MNLMIQISSMAAWACFGVAYIVWLPAFIIAQYQSFHGKYWWKLQGTTEHYDVLAICKKKAVIWTVLSCMAIYPVAFIASCIVAMPSKNPIVAVFAYPLITMGLFVILKKGVGAKQEIGSGHTLLKFCARLAAVGATCLVLSMLLIVA